MEPNTKGVWTVVDVTVNEHFKQHDDFIAIQSGNKIVALCGALDDSASLQDARYICGLHECVQALRKAYADLEVQHDITTHEVFEDALRALVTTNAFALRESIAVMVKGRLEEWALDDNRNWRMA